MHEILEVLGHVMRFAVSIAALGCGVAAAVRFSFHPKSVPFAAGFAAFGVGDLCLLAFRIFGFGGDGLRYVISGYFVLASLVILFGIKPLGDCFREAANAK